MESIIIPGNFDINCAVCTIVFVCKFYILYIKSRFKYDNMGVIYYFSNCTSKGSIVGKEILMECLMFKIDILNWAVTVSVRSRIDMIITERFEMVI